MERVFVKELPDRNRDSCRSPKLRDTLPGRWKQQPTRVVVLEECFFQLLQIKLFAKLHLKFPVSFHEIISATKTAQYMFGINERFFFINKIMK